MQPIDFQKKGAQCHRPSIPAENLQGTLAAHAANNLRVLNQMAAELLNAAAERNLPRIDETLFFELFSLTGPKKRRNNHLKK